MTQSSSWPDERLLRLFGIEHPIVQAPMLGTSTLALAAAVTGAGGLGVVACGAWTPERMEEEWTALRRLTDGPVALNLFVGEAPARNARLPAGPRRVLGRLYARLGAGPMPQPAAQVGPLWQPRMTEALLDLRPSAVSFHFGLPPPGDVARIKAAGFVILSSATTVREARALEAAGVDAVIAQGWEAGGHRGSHGPGGLGEGVGLMALVPQVADAVRVPVIAAGGIADARGIRAALALGAAGVQMGSAFLLCPEVALEAARRDVLRRATDEDTVLTDAVSGRPARARRSELSEAMRPYAGRLLPYPAMYALSGPLQAASGPEGPATFHLYGQAAALGREEPAADLVRRLAREALAPR